MKRISRLLVIGGLMVAVIITGCNLPAQTQVPVGTILPNDLTQLSTSTLSYTSTATPVTPVIPITGENVVQLQCQFCVNDQTHAMLVFPEFAIFDVETTTTAPVTCLTAEIVNGKRVVVCHGPQLTTFNLKICSDITNCLLYPITLQACPLGTPPGTPLATPFTSTPMTPIYLTPINTLRPPTGTPIPPTSISTLVPTQTGTVPPPTTPTTAPTLAPTTNPTVIPTTPVPPTTEPTTEPTSEPTQAPTDGQPPGRDKPTRTPRP